MELILWTLVWIAVALFVAVAAYLLVVRELMQGVGLVTMAKPEPAKRMVEPQCNVIDIGAARSARVVRPRA